MRIHPHASKELSKGVDPFGQLAREGRLFQEAPYLGQPDERRSDNAGVAAALDSILDAIEAVDEVRDEDIRLCQQLAHFYA
ncbi:hypothetical protein D3C86_1734500 [compost metagenome]